MFYSCLACFDFLTYFNANANVTAKAIANVNVNVVMLTRTAMYRN